jgi:hypothetical protein
MALLAFGCVNARRGPEVNKGPVTSQSQVPRPKTPQEIDRNIEEMRKVEATLEQMTEQNRALRQALGECMKKTGGTYVDPRTPEQIETQNQERRERIAFLNGEIEALLRERATAVQFYQEKGTR